MREFFFFTCNRAAHETRFSTLNYIEVFIYTFDMQAFSIGDHVCYFNDLQIITLQYKSLNYNILISLLRISISHNSSFLHIYFIVF